MSGRELNDSKRRIHNSYGTGNVTYRIVTFSIGKFSDSKGSLPILRDREQRSKRSYLTTNSDGSFG